MDFEGFNLSVRGAGDPATLDAVERDFWIDLWRSPVLDAVADERIETRWYGPLQAMVIATLPETPLLNLLLGAAEPGAVREGHLAQALEWIDSLDLDCRVPIDLERPEAAAAEELLNQWGYRHTETQVRFVRDASPPDFPLPPGIEVIELEKFTEGFSELLCDGYELDQTTGWLFDCLPGRQSWKCYFALDEDGHCLAAAAMMVRWEVATHLGFAATAEEARGRGCHMALLHRCISDAGGRCPTLFAETTEPLEERDGPSAGCRNLLRAGFKQASVRSTWRRPG